MPVTEALELDYLHRSNRTGPYSKEALVARLSKNQKKIMQCDANLETETCRPAKHQFKIFSVREESILSTDNKTTTKHVTHWIQRCDLCGLTLPDSYANHFKTTDTR